MTDVATFSITDAGTTIELVHAFPEITSGLSDLPQRIVDLVTVARLRDPGCVVTVLPKAPPDPLRWEYSATWAGAKHWTNTMLVDSDDFLVEAGSARDIRAQSIEDHQALRAAIVELIHLGALVSFTASY